MGLCFILPNGAWENTPLLPAFFDCTSHSLLARQIICKNSFVGKSYVNYQNKGTYWNFTFATAKKQMFTHAHTVFVHRETLGSSLGFIKEMHSIAISGKHTLPFTYHLIALLLHKGKIDSCRFDALYFFN